MAGNGLGISRVFNAVGIIHIRWIAGDYIKRSQCKPASGLLDISCYDLHLFFQVIVFHTSPGHIRRLFLDLKAGKVPSFSFCF